MTKQNVVVSDCTTAIGKVRLAASNSVLFSPAIPKSLASLGGRIAISKKKLLKRLEIGGGARFSAWVDSMRDSSPTRTKSTASQPEIEEKTSWIVSVSLSLHASYFLSLIMVCYLRILSLVLNCLNNSSVIHRR